MFTPANYFEKIQGIDIGSMPEAIRQGHSFVVELTNSGANWEDYFESDSIKETVDIYFTSLQKQLEKTKVSSQSENPPGKAAKQPTPKGGKKTPVAKKAATVKVHTAEEARVIAKEFIEPYVLRGETVAQLNSSYQGASNGHFQANIRKNKIYVTQIKGEAVDFSFSLPQLHKEILIENGKQPQPAAPAKKGKPQAKTSHKQEPATATPSKPVERVDEELKFIKRYVSMHGKEKTREQILSFINALQRAILEKRIRKTSDYAEQIRYIQDGLIKLYNKMDNTVEIKIREHVLTEMMQIAGSEKVRLSVAYLKRYIGMQGKHITKEKAEKLLTLIAGALDKEKIAGTDPYMEKMKRVLSSLRAYIKDADQPKTLHIHEATLNGLQRALDGCGCGQHKGLQGIDPADEAAPDTVMNSMDFAKMKFKTLGFTGKWRDLIGDPSSNFTAMIFGKPKMGKSYLAVDFAGYLARNHGKVLYVAKEEGLDLTLQEKLNDKDVKHPNLFVSAAIPESLDDYDFIFLDSVSRLGLSPEDLRQLKKQYPSKSFIYVFQSTKQGNFRGENSFQHDVDVVIEVPEKGKAVQMGRFNQGGEMDIFNTKAGN